MKYELGVIGGGNMAEAIIGAVVQQEVIEPDRIIVADPSATRREVMQELGVHATPENRPVIENSSQVMLAVKPQMLPEIGNELKAIDRNRQIVLSIMAGISTQRIAEVIGQPARIVRIMPNTPLLVGLGMSAIAVGEHAREGDDAPAVQIFQAAGEVVIVQESEMDAVTAVSGSGPAYVFYLAEAMIEAGQTLGLSDTTAALLAKQTILGAGQLLKTSTDDPATLRAKVTSPGGTTQAAIEHMDRQQVKQHVMDAMARAAERSRELGK